MWHDGPANMRGGRASPPSQAQDIVVANGDCCFVRIHERGIAMDAAKVLLGLIVAGAVSVPSESAAQSGWSGAPAAPPASTYDRYGQPITSGAATISQRAQGAFTESGTAVRDGVEAGIRAANDQLSRGGTQAWDATRNATTQFGQQAQNLTNAAGNTVRTVADQTIGAISGQASSNPFAATANPAATSATTRGGVSSPWPTTPSTTPNTSGWPSTTPIVGAATTPGTAGVTAANGGWTSIGTTVAAPRLLIPQLPATTTDSANSSNFGATGAAITRNGPSFTPPAASGSPSLHSVLADPARTAAPASNPANSWVNDWNNASATQPATIARTGSQPSLGSTVRESDLVPLPGNPAATADPRATTVGRANDPFGDTWTQPALGTISANAGTAAGSTNQPAANTGFGIPPAGNQSVNRPDSQFAGPTNGQLQNSQTLGNFNTAGTNPNSSQMGNGNPGGRNQAASNGTTEPQPWMPLIASVLTLAGSLAANLYLGVSYLDARQKYQSLVRKTAETFRRVKAVAA
jgi:hypothetical protein